MTNLTSPTRQRTEFNQFLRELKTREAFAIPKGQITWSQLVAHVPREGRPVEIDAETWWGFLDRLPPRWMSGSDFVFAEGGNCFRLFWQDRGRYFARQLTDAETDRFCHLSGARRWE